MDKAAKENWILLIEKASLALLGGLFVLFPLVFTNITTDIFTLPKQAVLIFVVLILILLYGVKTLLLEKLRINRSPFDIPILLLIVAFFLSAIFSVARFDAIYNFVPFLLAAISFFAISYNVKNNKSLNVLILSLLSGGAIISIVALLNFLKIYIFPFDFAKTQTFTTLGSTLDQTIYLGLLLSFGLYFLYPFLKKLNTGSEAKPSLSVVLLGILTLLVAIGFTISLYILITINKPIILPLATGFQTAFAAISQDAQRLIQGFLFGSGYGEFSLSFLRFKQAAFNANQNIWNLTFFRSTTFVLELLATTGLLGISAFLFLVYKIIRDKKPFIPAVLFVLAFFVLPLSFYHLTLFFFMLGLLASLRNLSGHPSHFEVELSLMVSKKGFFVLSEGGGGEKFGKALSSVVFIFILIFVSLIGLLTFDFVKSNIDFQKSLVFAQSNNGTQTYNFQSKVLNSATGRYVDAYHRIFSQTNLALANSLANSISQGSSPSAQQTQTISSLVQQSINSGRAATTISPYNAINWQNLSSIYRALIGFGQNADSFALLAAQQSTVFDPTNPQEYINLGGIYYQLKAWDRAIEQFQVAINLKPDLPNAYYNLGFAYWQKGDLQNALAALNRVKDLVGNDKASLDKINSDIKNLEDQISQGSQAQAPVLQQPETALPPQNPPVKIPAPEAVISPTETPTPTSSPTSPPLAP